MRADRYALPMNEQTGPKVVHSALGAQSGIHADGAEGLTERTLLGLAEGAGHFDVRYIRLQPGGVSSDHAHPWEQANYVLEGRGTVELDTHPHAIAQHDFVYTPPNVRHRFVSEGDGELVLLAMRGPQSS